MLNIALPGNKKDVLPFGDIADMGDIRRNDIILVTGGGEEHQKFRIKKIRPDTLTLGKIRCYHRIKPILRSLASMAYWWCKVQRKKWSVWRLRRYDI